MEFYEICVAKIDDITKKGIAAGVFTFAPQPEDILTLILGPTLFTIRNRKFIEIFVVYNTDEKYMQEAEKKVKSNILMSVFAILGYVAQ